METALKADLSTKEQFFRTSLVPTGQLLELYLQLVEQLFPVSKRSALNQSFFEPLNLASVYAIHPGNSDLSKLEVALENLRKTTVEAFSALGAKRDSVLLNALAHKNNTLVAMRPMIAEHKKFVTRMDAIGRDIHAAIEYAPSLRQRWLEQHVGLSALTKDGRTNRWRTFVRNLSWDYTLRLLKLDGKTPSARENFSSRIGQEKAPLFWAEVFPAGKASSASSASSRLPAGVKVSSGSTGELVVQANFDPRAALSASQLKQLKAPGAKPADELVNALLMRSFMKTCGLDDFVKTVHEAAAFMQEQRQDTDRVRALYDAWANELKLQQVKRKLSEHFSAEELGLLAAVLKSKAS